MLAVVTLALLKKGADLTSCPTGTRPFSLSKSASWSEQPTKSGHLASLFLQAAATLPAW